MKTLFHALALGTCIAALTSPIHAQLDRFDIPGSKNTTDVDIIADKGGRLHAISATTNDAGSASRLRYDYFNGTTWIEGPPIDTSSSPDDFSGIDLEIAPDSTLHATYYTNDDVLYSTLRPAAPSWDSQFIQRSTAPSGTAFERSRTSIALNGDRRHVVYNRAINNAGDIATVYATSIDGTTWSTEDIRPGSSTTAIEGWFPVISASPRPFVGFVLGSAGPTIAYYQSGEYRLIERRTTIGIGGGSTSWSQPETVANGPSANLAASFFSLDFAIQNGVLHLICDGTSPDGNTGGVLYHRQARGFGGGFGNQVIVKTYENVSSTIADAGTNYSAMSLHAPAAGGVQVAYTSSTGLRWDFWHATRNSASDWAGTRYLGTGQNSPGQVQGSAIATDIFGRATTITHRNDPVGGNQASFVDTQLTRSVDLFLTSTPFPLSPAPTASGETLQGQSATDSHGGTGYAYETAADTASYTYRDPSSGALTTTQLDLGFPTTRNNPTIDGIHAAAFGAGKIGIVTAIKSSGAPGSLSTTLTRKLFIFDGSQLTTTETLASFSNFAASNPPLAIAGDPQGIYIASIFLNTLVGNNEIPPTLIARNTDGSRNSTLEESFNANVPGGYSRVQLAAAQGRIAFAGIKDGGLDLHYQDSNSWENDVTTPTGGTAPLSFDIEYNGSRITITYSESSTLYIASTVRSAGGPLSGPLDRRRISSSFGGYAVNHSRDFDGNIHVVRRNLDGASRGTVTHTVFEGFPNEMADNISSSTTVVGSATGGTATTFDPFGYPVILAVEQRGTPTRNLYFSPLTTDTDADGLPLFAELALCRDPNIADRAAITGIRLIPGASRPTSLIGFDRPPGPATATRDGITAGAFRYDLDVATNLQNWSDGTLLFERIPASGDEADFTRLSSQSTGVYQEAQYIQRFPDNNTFSTDRVFHRLRISLR